MSSDSGLPQVQWHFDDLAALRAEVESNLTSARAFVPGATGVAERQRCELILIHPESDESITLLAEAVWVRTDRPGLGIGLELVGFDPEMESRLRKFASGVVPTAPTSEADNVFARVRRFTVPEQLRAAREGDHAERVALERIYGKAVWDVLIRNPRITAPELTRLARNRNLSKQIVDALTGNVGWLGSSELRRALLMNPQVTGIALDKVLRATPKLELTRMATQTSLPAKVRQAIKKIQGR